MGDIIEEIMKDPEKRARLFYIFNIALFLANLMLFIGIGILIFKLVY